MGTVNVCKREREKALFASSANAGIERLQEREINWNSRPFLRSLTIFCIIIIIKNFKLQKKTSEQVSLQPCVPAHT